MQVEDEASRRTSVVAQVLRGLTDVTPAPASFVVTVTRVGVKCQIAQVVLHSSDVGKVEDKWQFPSLRPHHKNEDEIPLCSWRGGWVGES